MKPLNVRGSAAHLNLLPNAFRLADLGVDTLTVSQHVHGSERQKHFAEMSVKAPMQRLKCRSLQLVVVDLTWVGERRARAEC